MGITKKMLEDLGLTGEQADKVFAERGKEITEEKAKLDKLETQLAEKDKSIAEMSEKVKGLDGTEKTLKELQDKVAAHEKENQERIESENKAKLDSELLGRFKAIQGENKFSHPLVEKGKFEEFKQALTNEEFKGKGDSDVFSAIIKPEDLENPQRAVITIPGGSVTNESEELNKARAVMGLPTQK